MSDSVQLCSSNEDDAVNNEVFFSSPRSSNSKNGQGLSSVFPKLDETCGDIKKIEQLGADGTNKTNIDDLKTQLWKKSYEDSTVEKSKKIPSPPSIDHILKENFSSVNLMNIEDSDAAVKKVALSSLVIWVTFLFLTMKFSPSDSMKRTEGAHRTATIIECVLLYSQLFMRISSITLAGKWKNLSGFFVAAIILQFVAGTTGAILAFGKTPVFVDPITGRDVFLIRWCEWAPLACLMTFLVESISAQSMKQPLITGISQGVSVCFGLLLPLCRNRIFWISSMTISCLLYFRIIVRAVHKLQFYRCVSSGNTFEEKDRFERARLASLLMIICAATFSILVLLYFLAWILPFFFPSLKYSPWGYVGDCCFDLLSKLFFLHILVDVHASLFDSNSRTERRLAELSRMLSIIWDNSSDVLAIGNVCQNESITTRVSPTFFKMVGLPETNELVITQNLSEFVNASSSCESPEELKRTRIAKYGNREAEIRELMVKAWNNESGLLLTDFSHENGTVFRCEAQTSRINETSLVVIIRDITERQKRFDAEKLAATELTARKKDAEVNRFTRHEVKNGLLAAIGICDGLKEGISRKPSILTAQDNSVQLTTAISFNASRLANDLDRTLNDVLDMVLVEAMARDLVHGIYDPKLEALDLVALLTGMHGYDNKRFPIFSSPSPFPSLNIDPHLVKYIHQNAITNACKYGKKGGIVRTNISYSEKHICIEVVNEPGQQHNMLLSIPPDEVQRMVFSPGKRLHSNISSNAERRVSAGDGAWIIEKCAVCLNGTCEIQFKPDRTVFKVKFPSDEASSSKSAPINSSFKIPPGAWGVALDDSVVQRKLMGNFFSFLGIASDRTLILGANPEEILGFVEKCTSLVSDHLGEQFLVIVDENLEVVEDGALHETVFGSKFIEQIRKKLHVDFEKNTLMLVRSANDSASDVAIYKNRAHGFLSKSPVRRDRIPEIIRPLWCERFGYGAPSSIASESFDEIRDSDEIDCNSDLLLREWERLDQIVSNKTEYKEQWWPPVREHLHTLKGDLMSLCKSDDLSDIVCIIDELRESEFKPPENFILGWQSLRSKTISLLSGPKTMNT